MDYASPGNRAALLGKSSVPGGALCRCRARTHCDLKSHLIGDRTWANIRQSRFTKFRDIKPTKVYYPVVVTLHIRQAIRRGISLKRTRQTVDIGKAGKLVKISCRGD